METPAKPTAGNATGSSAVACLECAWELLRSRIVGLPTVVIAVVDAKGRDRKRGHFALHAWRSGNTPHEVAISPALFGDPAGALATLVHEAAHALLFVRGATQAWCPEYHRKDFRDLSRTLGLDCRFVNTRRGWALTAWPAAGPPPAYADILGLLSQGLAQFQGHVPPSTRMPPPRSLPASGLRRLECRCERRRAIYACGTAARTGRILCTRCGAPFTPVVRIDGSRMEDSRSHPER